MATSAVQKGPEISRPAGEDLSSFLYHFVKPSTTTVVSCDTAGERALGVLLSTGTLAQAVTVQLEGVAKIKAGAAIAVFDELQVDTDATAIPAAAGDHVVAIALEAAADGDLFEALLIKGRLVA